MESGSANISPRAHSSERLIGLGAFLLAAILSVGLLLSVTGTLQRLLGSLAAANSAWLLPAYNGIFGVLPTILWFGIFLGLWTRSRSTPGSTLMLAALLAWLGDQFASNLWPVLPQGSGTTALMWLASVLGILWPLLFGLGVVKSGFLPPLVSRLALVWGATHAAVATVGTVVSALVGSQWPIGFSAFAAALRALPYIPSLLLIVFLVALGVSVFAPERLASMSARLQVG